MATRTQLAAAMAVVVSLTVACGGGGGGGSGNSGSGGQTAGAFTAVQLLSHVPADGAVQVAIDAVLQLEFDAPMALDSFGDEDTWLRPVGSTSNVAGTWSRGSGGRVTFQPSAPLQRETDYVCQLSALTCDETGRILDLEQTFTFRTIDTNPPQLLTVDVTDQSTGQSRTRTFTATFDEAIAPASVHANSVQLIDIFGFRYAAAYSVQGATVTLDPRADLPGDRRFTLLVGATVADRAGNLFGTTQTRTFRTAVDAASPAVTTVWPPNGRTGVSPLVQPTFTFDESMDPATVEAASLLFQDQFGSVVPFRIDSSADQRTLRLQPQAPLAANRTYTLAFLLGGAAATDVSGNTLQATQAMSFTTGADATPPALAGSTPTNGETRVPGGAIVQLTFAEALDADWIDTDLVTMTVGGEPWVAVVEQPTATTLRVTPVELLPTDSVCRVTLRGGHEGVRDLAGNVLAQDLQVSFTTSADAALPRVIQLPPDGATGVAPSSHVTFVFDAPMDPATLTSTTLRVCADDWTPLAGDLVLSAGNRVATFTPAVPLSASTYYRTRVVGGSAGARRLSGNWFTQDQNVRFRTGTATDTQPPSVTATINQIPPARTTGLVVPPAGFTIDIAVGDSQSQWPDLGRVEVQFAGTGSAPGSQTLLATAVIDYGTVVATVPAADPLTAGDWTLTVTAYDLSGNAATSAALPFTVAEPIGNLVPFERTQVVWVRTDLDRDSNGTPDFDEDLLRLGLATAGDPIGRNAAMRTLLLDGILAQANHLYGRGARGEPLDSGSVALRFARRQPIALPHMQMALGGLDPEGSGDRDYGDESTGILGRAYYDYRNSSPLERNTSTSPGLGVFPAEMWLYQTRIHLQVYPSFLTTFAQKFKPLCPAMGGTPAGAHALDAVVLAPEFDYATANSTQRARWTTIMTAADDWATVIGIILAHEVGHSVGLVAPGPAPGGLFGDSSLHDTFSSAAEVMAASVGYEAMTTLDYHFRDIDLAYLRQRVLLR
ncbi:MAG: Ig-like domain-containing protein [Planctomycetes bacterium]|nr:Ig-like domain-containing protein [Planctomycetota bacterium]